MKASLIRLLIALKMAYIKQFLWRPLIEKTRHPQQVQDDLLRQILRHNQDTKFGQHHQFKFIDSYAEYCNNVPVCDYEAIREYIEDQENDQLPHLNCEQPVMYAQTSGTTGKPKIIPILQSTIKLFKRSQHIVAYAIYANIPGAYHGKMLAITSPATERRLQSGTPCGAMSGLIYQSMPALMQAKYVLPADVFDIPDYDLKYYEIARLALAEKNITMIATANPSTLVKLDQVMNDYPDKLIEDIKTTNSIRAKALVKILDQKGRLVFADIWPDLKSVTTWTGGNCRVLIPELRKKLPIRTRIVELGYLASEFRGGINIDVLDNKQIPTLQENFLEFVEQNHWENDQQKFLRLTEIEMGKHYYIFATTQNGLYRYNINDLIKVTGWFNKTPTIEFVQKGKGVLNMTGEKLYEGQLVQAMIEAIEHQGAEIRFFKMLGNPERREYTLFVEYSNFDVLDVQHRLCELNIEFDAKLKSGRLLPIRYVALREGTGEAYKQHCLENGQREGQFKMSYLQNSQDCAFGFNDYVQTP